MKKMRIVSLLLLAPALLFAQAKDPVLMEIAGKNVLLSEFETIFNKNNTKDAQQQTLDEYVDLFVNFKLKVQAALDAGIDTSEAFTSELSGYRKQLAQPYLSDKDANETLMKEAYERMLWDIRASHILIRVDADAAPKDTIEAYNKILKIRKEILAGKDFAQAAKEYTQDPSGADNGGELGYFTAFYMVYPFETAAYTTKKGEISQPVRTKFGYHLLKITDKRKAVGTIKTAHIMVKAHQEMSPEELKLAEERIQEIYKKLQAGESFEKLAQDFSDDKGSASRGGELSPFGVGRMVPEYEEAAFALKANGDYSAPVKTDFGWHIIKRIEHYSIKSYEELMNEIKIKVTRDSRAEVSKQQFVNKLKKQYELKEYPKNRPEIASLIDNSFFEGKWSLSDKPISANKPLFDLEKKTYTQRDLLAFMEARQTRRPVINKNEVVNQQYAELLETKILELEDANLERKYPDFKILLQEYRDGILLFEITDRNVWTKAVKDTTGIEAFYQTIKNKYMWPERADAVIYTANNQKTADAARKVINKMLKKGVKHDEVLKQVNKKDPNALSMQKGLYTREELPALVEWKKGLSLNYPKNNKVAFVYINEIKAPTPKDMWDVRGLVTSEYQNQLEKEWIQDLRKKYPVVINQEVLKQVKK